jgi:hypothetical protein
MTRKGSGMKLFNLCAFFVLAGSAVAGVRGGTAQAYAGTWRLDLSPELKQAAVKLGMPEPSAEFVLRDDQSFTHTASNASGVFGCRGQFEVRDGYLLLNAQDQFPVQKMKSLRADVQSSNSLMIDGLRYVRSGATSIDGTWTLHRGESEDGSIRFVFKKDGTFVFAGPGYGSAGHYECNGSAVTLIWNEVDGEKVDDGSMRKTLLVGPDGFMVDTYHYCKRG